MVVSSLSRHTVHHDTKVWVLPDKQQVLCTLECHRLSPVVITHCTRTSQLMVIDTANHHLMAVNTNYKNFRKIWHLRNDSITDYSLYFITCTHLVHCGFSVQLQIRISWGRMTPRFRLQIQQAHNSCSIEHTYKYLRVTDTMHVWNKNALYCCWDDTLHMPKFTKIYNWFVGSTRE